MIAALLADARNAMIGLARLVSFREGWRPCFDTSTNGLIRSFGAMILAAPAFVMFVLAANYIVSSAGAVSAEARYTPLEAIGSYARIWLLFPVVAIGVVSVLGLKHRYVSWVVVHNWAVFALLHLAALLYLLYPAGLADTTALAMLLQLYLFARLFLHWRVAVSALETGMATGAAAAGIPIILDLLAIYLVSR